MPTRDPDVTTRQLAAGLVTFNPWIGQREQQLEANLLQLAEDTGWPMFIYLQEVWDWGGTIPGYYPVRAPRADFPHPEARSTIMLVRRRGTELLHEGFRQVDGPNWIGPKHGIVHPPRVFARASVLDRASGLVVEGIAVHRTPGGPDPHIKINAESWAAEDRLLEAWASRIHEHHPDRPIIIGGDHNDRLSTRHPLSIASLAERLDARPVMRGIDGFLMIGADPARGSTTELERSYGSDGHHPVATTATTNPQEKP